MVAVPSETPVAAERRLRRVMRAATREDLPGAWGFEPVSSASAGSALALVRDDDEWCALVRRDRDGDGELLAVSFFALSAAIEHSGFVGWLADTVKRRLGSSIVVLCGSSARRGGVFGYYGYPLALEAQVRGLFDELARPLDPHSLELRTFRVVETSPESAISPDTVFEFRETAAAVHARYSGGRIAHGDLVAERRGDSLRASYAQLHTTGELRTGTSDLEIKYVGEAMQLIERYTWADGRGGVNVLESSDA